MPKDKENGEDQISAEESQNDAEEIELKEDFDPFAVVLLIRWLEHNVPGPGGKKRSIESIAKALYISRHVLNRFLSEKLNRDEQAERARDYAKTLKPLLDQGRPFPRSILDLYATVYGDNETLDQKGPDKPVERPEVLRHRSMVRVPKEHAPIEPLVGLSALVRTANEHVKDKDSEEPDAMLPGWSISILNVPPQQVQKGYNHPLFVLRQKGLARSDLTIEGVVLTLGDRLVFKGIDNIATRTFNATMPVGADWKEYRNSGEKAPIYGSGVMLGLSSERGVFAGLFDLFAIPRSTLPENHKPEDMDAFKDRYKKAVDKHAGVRDLKGTVAALEALGIGGGSEWLADTLRNMRDRARNRLLLKP